jgi:hypothetical protein
VNLATTSLEDSILLDFRTACADLAEAKQAVRARDTPAARARLEECAALVDAVLDLSNATASARV